MKKLFSFILAAALMLALMLACLSGCGPAAGSNSSETSSEASSDDSSAKRLSIVATVFPEYDWTRAILGDVLSDSSDTDIDLTLLVNNGTDMHSFQPTASDIVKISMCDLFIYVGGESDSWVEKVLENTKNPDRKVINLLDVLGSQAKEEELKEGMEDEDEANGAKGKDGAETSEDSESDAEAETDEHVWLSLRNASLFVTKICGTLSDIDNENADIYAANAAAYQKKLAALDSEYQSAADTGSTKTLLFADRFPFRYLTDDYGIDYYAAFAGCSAETEASFDTILFLAGKVDELGLNSVMIIDGSDDKIAKTVIENTSSGGQRILVLNSMQSITQSDIESGVTYMSVMEDNLNVLKEALN